MAVPIHPRAALPGEEELARFEGEIGFALPDDYRDFLRRTDGGRFDPPEGGDLAYLAFPAEAEPPLPPGAAGQGARDVVWDVAVFHGLLRAPGEYGDLREVHAAMRDWDHPPELLPVASSIGNAKYFLCGAGPRRGQILVAGDAYLDKRADGHPITPDDYHRLLPGFGRMLDGLAWTTDEDA